MKKFFLFFIALFFSPILLWAASDITSRHVLANGMVVLISEMPTSPTVSIYALVKTGSATEGKYLGMGISHFVEHMLFKGTKKRAVGAISKEVSALGGRINASTSYDETMYTLDVPKESFSQGFDIIADMVMNSVFDPEEVKKEREVIFGEMRMINDRPERKLGDLVSRSVYLRHPYRHPIIGYVPLFEKITQEELVDYYTTHYIPNNTILSIAGPVKSKDVMSLVTKAFKDFQPKPYVDRNLPKEPEQISPRRVEEEYPSDAYRFSMAYQGVNLFDEDMYAMDVLAMILGQGESSRLYLDVFKKQGLVDSIGASNNTPVDRGVFEINTELSNNNVDAAIKAIKKNIEDIQKNGVGPDELEKTKRQVLSSTIFGRQTSPEVAYRVAVDEAFAGDYAFADKYLQHIRQVTNQDIVRVARKYFLDDHLTVVVLKPQAKEDQKPSQGEQHRENEIKKEIFSNGLTILLKEDHTFPLISMNVLVNAGTREEPAELNGLNELTADLWVNGTKRWSSKQIAQMVESHGATMNSYGGQNTMSLRMNSLSEDLRFTLDLIEECIKNPSFAMEDFNKQQEKNIADIKQRADSIFDMSWHHLKEALFITHPMRLETLGTMESVERITRNDVALFYQRSLTPRHMVISFYGDIDPEQALAELKKRFGNLPDHPVKHSKFHEDQPQALREKNFEMDKEQAALFMGFHAPDLYDPDRYGMDVISSIFGSSLNGRMFVKIREELGNAYTLGSGYSPSLDAGMIYFYVLTTDAQVDKVKEILLREIQKILDVPVASDELASTKAKLKGDFILEFNTVGQLAFLTALHELYGLGYNHYTVYASQIDSVTNQDIQRIARKYLDPKRATIIITRPIKKDKKQ